MIVANRLILFNRCCVKAILRFDALNTPGLQFLAFGLSGLRFWKYFTGAACDRVRLAKLLPDELAA